MIKEIKNPLPSIFDMIEHRKLIARIKKKTKATLGIYDVAFISDPTLIDELAEKCNINKGFALSFLTIFFEEIKKGLMEGTIINLKGFGKFYINGPHRGCNGKVVLPPENCPLIPKFKASPNLKKDLSR